MLLLIDNYDSFSYNLYQLVGSVEPDIRVIRNDAMTVEEIEALHPAGIILSPPVCALKWCRSWGAKFPSWGSAWVISPSAPPTGPRSATQSS